MATLDELQMKWAGMPGKQGSLDQSALQKMFKKRVNQRVKTSMQYFWASLTLQIIVYGLLSHVLVKFWNNVSALWMSVTGVLIYIPFTIMLLKKFKALAIAKVSGNTSASMREYLETYYKQLNSFFTFKKWYEMILIPVSTALGTMLVFQLFFPGGVSQHVAGVVIVFALSLASCAYAIHRENVKSFVTPLRELKEIMLEME